MGIAKKSDADAKSKSKESPLLGLLDKLYVGGMPNEAPKEEEEEDKSAQKPFAARPFGRIGRK